MPDDPVADLLSLWLRRCAAGVSVTPDELCRDAPQHLPELRKRIGALARSDKPATAHTVDHTPVDGPVPASLGGYRVVREIGEGGMGLVLEAEDPGLGRRVAIKVMRPELAAVPAVRERFLREARAVAAVRHDHVVPVYHVGDHTRTPFLVMPLLEGESLADRIARAGPLPPAEVARIGREAALGLSAAHAAGLVHRDVKPANLWLEAPNGRVLVLDFGLARAADRPDGLTNQGAILGTPGYFAPEQANGLAVDARADLFGLGATLYHAATGVRPFRGDTLTAVLRAVAEENPPAPCAVNPAVPPSLSGLIMWLLNKDPNGRPSSAEVTAAALAHVSLYAAETVSDVPAERPPEAHRAAGRRPQIRLGCTITISLCLLVGIVAGYEGYLSFRAPPPNPPPPTLSDESPPPQGGTNGWSPLGWSPVEEAGTIRHGSREYHRRLTRTVAGETLVAILVTPTRPDDPAPFYLTENKVTNRAFRGVWERTDGFGEFLRSAPEERKKLLPGEWRSGPMNLGGERLGIDRLPDAPVLGVTVPEAMLFAQELGGRLPTFEQLQKAVGIPDNKHPGPAGPAIDAPPSLVGQERVAYLRAELSKRNLALGLPDGPWPVTRRTADVSYCGIHQLLSNGLEWTGTRHGDHPSTRLKLLPLPAVDHDVVLFGQWWGSTEILTLAAIADRYPRVAAWTKWDEFAGFRIVLDDLP